MSNKHKLPDKSPFKGPRPFTEDDKEWFFGRDYENDEVLSLILGHKLVLIYGRSGAGKTSLLNAGIIPALKENGLSVFPIVQVGGSFNKSLDPSNPYIFNALQCIISADDSVQQDSKKTLSQYLTKVEEDQGGVKKKSFVIIFDQLEQLFTNIYSEDKWREQRQDFFKQISDALDSDKFLLRIVFVIRDDYLYYLLPFGRKVPENFRSRFHLERLSKDQAKEAIEEPLKKGLRELLKMDEESIDNLLNSKVKTSNGQSISMIDNVVNSLSITRVVLPNEKPKDVIGDFVEPTQLQIVCEKLWSNIISAQGRITQEELEKLVNLEKSLEDLYVKSIRDVIKNSANEIKNKERERDVRGLKAIIKEAYHLKSYIKKNRISEDRIREWIDNKLITEEDTRNSVRRGPESTEGMPNNIIEALERNYLISSQRLPSGTFYKLTHDRLIKPIRKSNQESRLNLAREKSRDYRLISIISISVVIIGIALFVMIPMFQNEPCAKRAEFTLQEGTAAFPDDTAINENTNMIYVIIHPSSPNDPSIKVVDCTKYDKFEEGIAAKGASKLAIDPKTNLIYVANTGNNTVSVIQDDSNNNFLVFLKRLLPITNNLHIVKPSIQVGNQPKAIAVNPNTTKVYVANTGSNSVSVIDGGDTSNPHVLKNITVGDQPNGIAIDPSTNKVYVANTGSNSVSVIDGKTNNVTSVIQVNGKQPLGIDIDPTTNKVYVANTGSNSVSVIKDHIQIKNLLVGKNITAIAVNPTTHKVYVANTGSNNVSIIDGTTDRIINNVTLPFYIDQHNTVAVNPKTNKIYVVGLVRGQFSVINGTTDKIIPSKNQQAEDVTSGLSGGPTTLAFNPYNDEIYSANRYFDTVSFLNGSEFPSPLGVAKVHSSPYDIAFDESNHLIYVVNQDSNTIAIIKPTVKK